MITTAAITALVLLMAVITYRRHTVAVLATRTGTAPDGTTWAAELITPHTLRLRRNGCVWVERCGPRTLSTLSARYAITWE